MVFLLSLEREVLPVSELFQELLEEGASEAARDQRLQRQGAALQVSLLRVHIAISLGHLQAREASAQESRRLRHRRAELKAILSQGHRDDARPQRDAREIGRVVAECPGELYNVVRWVPVQSSIVNFIRSSQRQVYGRNYYRSSFPQRSHTPLLRAFLASPFRESRESDTESTEQNAIPPKTCLILFFLFQTYVALRREIILSLARPRRRPHHRQDRRRSRLLVL